MKETAKMYYDLCLKLLSEISFKATRKPWNLIVNRFCGMLEISLSVAESKVIQRSRRI